MDNKETLDITLDDMGVSSKQSVETVKSDKEFIGEPTVIHLDDADYDRISDDFEDDEKSYKKSTRYRRPKDETLLKFSAISCILGILSCTLFLGNVPLAVVGLLFGLTAEVNKYKNTYTKIGLICCAIGCIIGFAIITLFVSLVILMIIALFIVAVLALLALLILLAMLLPL